MIATIFTGVMIFMWVVLVLTYGNGAEQNGEYTLGITLPKEGRDNEEVQALLQEYRKKKRWAHLLGFLTIFLNLLIQDWTSILLVYIMVWFGGIMFWYTKIVKQYAWKLYDLKKSKGWLILTTRQQEEGAQDDDDIYWLTGKKNPHVSDGMQPKRIGYGLELNAGSKFDKIVIAVVVLFVLGLAGFMLKYDLAEVTMKVDRQTITIGAADMEEKITKADITEVSFLNDCPSMYKRKGYNGGKFNLGTFRVETIGVCETYVYVHNDTAILITTKDTQVLFNLKTKKETLDAYEELMTMTKQKETSAE